MRHAAIIALCALLFGAVVAAVPMIDNLYARATVSALAYAFLAVSLLWIVKR